MAFEIVEFEGFGTGGLHGINNSAGVTVVADSPSPNGTYCAELAFGGIMASNAFAEDGVMVTAFWVKFSDTTDIIGGEAAFMQCRDSGTGAAHWYCTWKDGGFILVHEADGTPITQIGVVAAATWYLIEVRWERGDPESMTVWWKREWGGYQRFLSGTFGGLDLEAGNADLFLYFANPFTNVAANTLRVGDWYHGNDSTAVTDLLGNFEVLTYNTDYANNAKDIGTANPADNWDVSADIPFGGVGGNMTLFNDVLWAAKRTGTGGAVYGPLDDTRYKTASRIRGGKWICDGQRFDKNLVWGMWDAIAGYTTTTEAVAFAGINYAVVVDGAHAKCPDLDQAFVIGIKAADGLNVVSIVDMACCALHEPAASIVVLDRHEARGTMRGICRGVF